LFRAQHFHAQISFLIDCYAERLPSMDFAEVRRVVITAMFSDDLLSERIVLRAETRSALSSA
jgi:hypothetical protein